MDMSTLWKKFAVRTGLAGLDPKVKSRIGGDYFYLRAYSNDVLAAPIEDLELLEQLERAVHTARSTAGHTHESNALIDLSQGMPDLSGFFPLDRIMSDAARRPHLLTALQKYPPGFGNPRALAAVAKKITADTGVTYDHLSEILLCNGASQGIAHALECFVDPGMPVVLFDPCYLFYQWLAQTRGLRIRRVNTINQRLDPRQMERAMSGAKAIIINSPANPDGSRIHLDDLKLIAALAARHNCIILSDEVYSGFSWAEKFTSIASLPSARGRTIVISSLSKSHGLPGLRMGWCAGPAPLIRPLAMLMSIRVPCVNATAQETLPDLIDAEFDFSQRRHTEFLERRDAAMAAALDAGFNVETPDGAFYLWNQIPGRFLSGHDFARWCLKECQVAIMPGEPFGPSGKSMVRMSWGGPSELFSKAMQRIKETLPSAR